MKEIIEYIVEYKGLGKRCYSRTGTSFRSKEKALGIASKSGSVSARVIEQRRKIIKTFPIDGG